MQWSTKLQRIYIELIISWLRSEIEKLNNVLVTIEKTQDYHDEYVCETLKSVSVAIRQINKFIDAN